MPTISEAFQDYEIDQLMMIAEQWGIEDDIAPKSNPLRQLSNLLNEPALFFEVFSALPDQDQSALISLLNEGGRTAASQFFRNFGKIRELGAITREKERPDRNPKSISENLFFKGLIGLSFFNEGDDTKEYVYLPEEFINFIRSEKKKFPQATLPPSISENELKRILHASDRILDQICLLLAALRGEISKQEVTRFIPLGISPFLGTLLRSMHVVDGNDQLIDTEKVRELMKQDRSRVFSEVVSTWIEDASTNELRLLPNLTFKGKWVNDPVKTRKRLFNIFKEFPGDSWTHINDLINWMYQTNPDFQRSGGEYDSWFIKDSNNDDYLKGIENWHRIEGELIKFFVTGPFHWLGFFDIGWKKGDTRPYAFRKSSWADNLFDKKPLQYENLEIKEFTLRRNGEIIFPLNPQRELLYQIARFCVWKGIKAKAVKFRINPTALSRADKQGITSSQIKKLFQKNARKPLPTNIFDAIDRWGNKKEQILLDEYVLLQVRSEEVLDLIEKSSLKKFMVDRLNSTTAIVIKKDINRLEEALTEKGYFLDIATKV